MICCLYVASTSLKACIVVSVWGAHPVLHLASVEVGEDVSELFKGDAVTSHYLYHSYNVDCVCVFVCVCVGGGGGAIGATKKFSEKKCLL